VSTDAAEVGSDWGTLRGRVARVGANPTPRAGTGVTHRGATWSVLCSCGCAWSALRTTAPQTGSAHCAATAVLGLAGGSWPIDLGLAAGGVENLRCPLQLRGPARVWSLQTVKTSPPGHDYSFKLRTGACTALCCDFETMRGTPRGPHAMRTTTR